MMGFEYSFGVLYQVKDERFDELGVGTSTVR